MVTVAMDQDVSSKPFSSDEDRWAAVLNRDPDAEGSFYYSVKTTGVYCRPTCGARPALRENVTFHVSPQDAERSGFRPCKRCRPDRPSLAEQRATAVAKACRLIEESDEIPGLDALAETAGMSRFHFHRVFRSVTGLTPTAYAAAHRADRVRAELSRRETVTEAIYGAGFNSNGRFYARSSEILGMTPMRFRSGGESECIRFAVGECSLGSILVAATDRGVCAIFLGDEPEGLIRDLENRFPKAQLIGADKEFEQMVATVIGFVEAPEVGLDLPLDVRGTAFQQRVWQALRSIPPGSTVSYKEVSERIGVPKSARAVAHACASNPLAVAIPCHRVVHLDGSPSGYRWGVDRKIALLNREIAP